MLTNLNVMNIMLITDGQSALLKESVINKILITRRKL